MRVGGFYRAPSRRELRTLVEPLQRARDIALATVRLVSGFDFPDCERDYEFVSLGAAGEYPFNAGHVVSNKGLDITPHEYDAHFEESHVKRSNALHSHLRGRPYLTGPIARYSLNSTLLSPLARDAAKEAGLGETCTNPFRSIVVRAVEVLYACDEALRIIDAYQEPDQPHLDLTPRAGVGYACTEAPRGMLYHRYRLDAEGTHPRCQDRAADLAEPAEHRGRSEDVRRRLAGHARRGAARPLRAGGAQPRSVHLVRDAFPEAGSGACLT